jgi:lysophospholipase L1-like esterase
MARRWIGTPFGKQGPQASGWYGTTTGDPIELAMLGDSSAVGLGADDPRDTPGAVIATNLSAITDRPVRLTVVAVVGAESPHLDEQVDRLLETTPNPDVAVVMIGANDVTHRIKPAVAVRALSDAVRRLRGLGAEIVVGTCPDLGTIEPIAQPLRYVARRWSRELAAAQTIGVVEAGGWTVSLADLIGEEFSARPRELFSTDRFHPSATGYARVAAVLLPSVCAVLGAWPEGVPEGRPAGRFGGGTDDVAHAAAKAASSAGTEVSGTAVDGATRGPRGRWARLLRRPSLPALPNLGGLPGLQLPTLANLPKPEFPTVPGLGYLAGRLRGARDADARVDRTTDGASASGHGTSRNGTTGHSTSRNGTTGHGTSDHGASESGHGTSDHGASTSRNGRTGHSTFDHGTFDHGTFDHGTFDHGTFDHGTSTSGATAGAVRAGGGPYRPDLGSRCDPAVDG